MQIVALNDEIKGAFKGMYDESLLVSGDGGIIALGVVEGSTPIGVLIAYVFLDEIGIQWIFVAPEYRGKKIAGKLLSALIMAAKRIKIRDIYMTFSADTEGIERLLKSRGFKVDFIPGWYSYEARLKDLIRIPEAKSSTVYLQTFLTVGKEKLDGFNKQVTEGEELIGVPVSIDPKNYSPFSCCSIDNEKISGLILVQTFEKDGKPIIELPWVYTGGESIHAMPALYNAVVDALKASYEPDTELLVSSINPTMEEILSKLMPKAEYKEVYFASLQL